MKGAEDMSAGKQTIFHTLHRFRALLLALSIIVVFVTTYLLILPALTLEKDEAAKQGGINLGSESVEPSAGELSYAGKAYDIKASYEKEAELPAETELQVDEITKKNDQYDQYYQKALKAVQKDTGEKVVSDFSFAHFYDISLKTDDSEVEPADTVRVSISYNQDIPVDSADQIRIIHFKENSKTGEVEAEVLKQSDTDYTIEKEKLTEAAFEAESFSVYAVVSINSATNLDGKSYALVTGIDEDPGATTGYGETWGTDYFTIIVNAHAMMDVDNIKVVYDDWAGNTSGLQSEGVRAWIDNTGSFVGGSVTQWHFERSGNGYRIYALDNGNKKYIYQQNNSATVELTSNQSSATVFAVTPNSDGTVLIHNGQWYLHNNANPAEDWNEWVSRNYIMTQNGSAPEGDDYKFRLCQLSDDFDSFAAQKVSASTITTDTNYVIYRKFENEQGNETLYALASDGSFVQVFDGGDTIYWRETDKNIYWNYDMEENYPVIFSMDPTTHERIYINPNHSTGQTLSATSAGLTLLGKDNGQYSSAIECWDQAAYDYAGLHVTVGNDGASLSTGTRVAGTSDEFLFAVASEMPGNTAETVETVDSDSLGIKITMFDYGDPTKEYAAGDKLPKMTDVAGSDEYTPHAAHALVKAYLEGGIPSSLENGAMTGLFTAQGSAVTAYRENINHLFLQSYYDENGTFRYRSEDNYAYLPFTPNPEGGAITGTDFIVYRQAATPYSSDLSVGHTYYHHGHFMPFNDIDMTKNLSRLMNQYGNAYENGEAVGEIPLGDGRTYEDLYGTQGIPNFYTGMKMEAGFMQPRDGKLDNGDDMVFKFTGDDDMWVYIDDVLVLDIGGIHEPLSGTIDFATGKVINPSGSSLAGEKSLYEIFQNVLHANDTPQAIKDKISSLTWKDVNGDGTPDTFADYSNHSFSAFYMERGAGASNLDIQFNLKVVRTNQFTVQKDIPEEIDERFANQVYKFQATYKNAEDQDVPLYAGIANVCSAVVYKDLKDEQGNPVNVPVDHDGYFYLRAGEAAVFMMADESIQYNVKEVGIDGSLIEQVDINGQQVTVTDDGAASTGYAMVADRTQVLFNNHPKTQNLRITKHLTADSAPISENENPVFEFRVYLETTVVDEGDSQRKLIPYSYAPYYLEKEIDGEVHYFALTGPNNTPVDQGTTPVVCSTTGRSGSINSIPPEYTIVIPNLVVGTNFYIEERLDNIPDGYEFVREELKEGTYDPNDLGTNEEIIDHILPRDQQGDQAFDPNTIGRIKQGVDAESHVFNKKPSYELPYTGGSGTIWLYVLGALLVVLSGTGLLLKKRRDAA